MPPKRSASMAFKAPRPKATSKDLSTPKSRTTAATKSTTGSTTARRRAKFIPAPAAASSSSPQSIASSGPEEEDDNDDGEPSEKDSLGNNETSSDATSPAAAAPPQPPPPRATRRPVVASRSEPQRRSPGPGAEADEDVNVPPVMPEKLLTALLYSHFQQAETKLGREARGLVGRYVETFVREAVARAIVERKGVAGGGDFLEVC